MSQKYLAHVGGEDGIVCNCVIDRWREEEDVDCSAISDDARHEFGLACVNILDE